MSMTEKLSSYEPVTTPTHGNGQQRGSLTGFTTSSDVALPSHEKSIQEKPSCNEISVHQLWLQTVHTHQSIFYVLLYFAYWIAALIRDASACAFLNVIGIGCILYLTVYFIKLFIPEQCENLKSTFQQVQIYLYHRHVSYALSGASIIFVIVILISVAWNDFSRLNPLCGYASFVLIAYLISFKRKEILWNPVLRCFFLQLALALFVLRTHVGYICFRFLGDQISALVSFASAGTSMVYGSGFLALHPFAFEVLPIIIFIASLISMIYFLGIFSTVMINMGRGLAWVLGCSTIEAITAACNLILSFSDVPVLLKPFLMRLTNAEIHALMTIGMASTSGSTLGAYIQIGVPANNLVACTVMSIPCGLAISKIVYPETEEPIAEDIELEKSKESNIIEAAARGAQIGVQIVLIIAGMLVAAVSIIAMLNAWLTYIGEHVGIANLTFTSLCSYLFYPIALLLGVPKAECFKAASLIGTKFTVNEFVAFQDMIELFQNGGLSERARDICTYALCGFANLGSIGVQLGAIAPLVPERTSDFSKLVFSSMICGNLATLITASLAATLM